jgi:hypothetical protein
VADVQAVFPFLPNPLKHVSCDILDGIVDESSQFWKCLWKWGGVKTVPDKIPKEEITHCQLQYQGGHVQMMCVQK